MNLTRICADEGPSAQGASAPAWSGVLEPQLFLRELDSLQSDLRRVLEGVQDCCRKQSDLARRYSSSILQPGTTEVSAAATLKAPAQCGEIAVEVPAPAPGSLVQPPVVQTDMDDEIKVQAPPPALGSHKSTAKTAHEMRSLSNLAMPKMQTSGRSLLSQSSWRGEGSFTARLRRQSGRKFVTNKADIDVTAPKSDDSSSIDIQRFQSMFHNESGELEPERMGLLANIVASNAFTMTCNIVIFLTCFNIVLATNYHAKNLTAAEPLWMQALGALLSMLYILEVALRIAVHRLYFFINEDKWWNILDFMLACTEMVSLPRIFMQGKGLQIGFLRSLRILKLARTLRVIHLVHFFKELRVLLLSLTNSMMTVLWCTLFVIASLLMGSMVLVPLATDYLIDHPEELCEEDGCLGRILQEDFGSVWSGAVSLYTAVNNDWGAYHQAFQTVSPGAGFIFLAFTYLFQFVLINLLTSMFVDQAMKLAFPDTEAMILEQRTNEHLQFIELKQEVLRFDTNDDGKISLSEFKDMISDDAMGSFMAAQGLDVDDAEAFYKMLAGISDEDSGVDLDDFIVGCMRMKGNAKSIDLQALIYEVRILSDRVKHLAPQRRTTQSCEARLPELVTVMPEVVGMPRKVNV